jgi:hypothetical protein
MNASVILTTIGIALDRLFFLAFFSRRKKIVPKKYTNDHKVCVSERLFLRFGF